MDPQPAESQFRFDKHRAEAVVTLVTNENIKGCFFTAASARRDGAERIGDLLNSETGFFPFEVHSDGEATTVLYNRIHVIAVRVMDDEARRDPGYAVAPRRIGAILLSNIQRVPGELRDYNTVSSD